MADAAKITDEMFGSCWNLKLLNVPAAWRYSTGAGVVVAVVDSGVDGSHKDLGWSGNVPLSSANSDAYNDRLYDVVTRDITSGQHPKIVPGWNFVDNNAITRDKYRHGTYLAGTIAAECDGFGMVGVAPDAMLMPIVVIDRYGNCPASRLADGIERAADMKADVITICVGYSYQSTAVVDAIAYAISKGCIVLAASGNRGKASMMYPAESSGALAIGGTSPTGARWGMSDYGENITAVAPGSAQPVTFWMRHRFTVAEGTSQACANMAGVAALVRSANKGVGQNGFFNLLKTYGSNAGVKTLETGYGFPDVGLMLEAIGHKATYAEIIRRIMVLSRATESITTELIIIAKELSDKEE